LVLALVLGLSLVAVVPVSANPADGDVTIIVQDQGGDPIAGATATLLFYGGGKGGYSMPGKSTDGSGSATFNATEIATWLAANSYNSSSQIYIQPGAKVETADAYGRVRTVNATTGFPCIPYNTPGGTLVPKPAMSFTYNMIMMSTEPVQTVWDDPANNFTVTATLAESLSVTPDVTRMRLIRNLVDAQPPAPGGSDDDWYMWNGTAYERWKGIATVNATVTGSSISATFSQGIFSDWQVGNKVVVRAEFGLNRTVDSVSCIDDYYSSDILRPSSYIHPAQINDSTLFYPTIQDAINAASSGDTIHVSAGTYVETGQIHISKSLTIVGADKATTIIKPAQNTTNIGDGRGWFLVDDGKQFNLSNVTLDGSGHKVYQGIRDMGSGTIANCNFSNIQYNPSGSDYAGTAIVVFGSNYNVDVTGCTFTAIGRVGVLYYGTGVTGSTFSSNTYTGKGAGDWLDYGVEVGAGATAIITGNTITNCKGVATVDNSTSAGILVSTYYGPGTTAAITGNTLTGNTGGIAVGIDSSDTSTAVAHNNNIYGNSAYGINSTAPTVDATVNWWGDASGPSGVGPGTGDAVSANVTFQPWLYAEVVASKTETVTNGTVDATDEADTEVAVTGTATVNVVKYAENPGGTPSGFTALGKYMDVYVPDTSGVTSLEIRTYYTDDEVQGFIEDSLLLYWWNSTAWVPCSDSGVDTASNYIWAIITNSTTPALDDLEGTPFGGGGSGAPTVTTEGATPGAHTAGLGMSYTTGDFSSVQVRFAHKRSDSSQWSYTNWVTESAAGTYGVTLSGLSGRTQYDFKAQLMYDSTVIEGNTLQFTSGGGLGCFIATAAYGTPTAEQIDVLRAFRDDVLLKTTVGCEFVDLYYQLSPPAADFIAGHEALRTLVRELMVDPIVWVVEATGNIWRN
jgi:hypothetical protein